MPRQTIASAPNYRPRGGQKSQRGTRRSAPKNDDNIFYPGQFVMVERQTFDQIVKSCRNLDSSEPSKPNELKKFEGLMCDKVKYGFDLKPLSVGNTISPMPVPQQSPNEPDALSLDDSTSHKEKALQKQMKQMKRSLNMDKKKKAEAKPGK